MIEQDILSIRHTLQKTFYSLCPVLAVVVSYHWYAKVHDLWGQCVAVSEWCIASGRLSHASLSETKWNYLACGQHNLNCACAKCHEKQRRLVKLLWCMPCCSRPRLCQTAAAVIVFKGWEAWAPELNASGIQCVSGIQCTHELGRKGGSDLHS